MYIKLATRKKVKNLENEKDEEEKKKEEKKKKGEAL